MNKETVTKRNSKRLCDNGVYWTAHEIWQPSNGKLILLCHKNTFKEKWHEIEVKEN